MNWTNSELKLLYDQLVVEEEQSLLGVNSDFIQRVARDLNKSEKEIEIVANVANVFDEESYVSFKQFASYVEESVSDVNLLNWSYEDWNNALITYYFKKDPDHNIPLFFVEDEVFSIISGYRLTIEDFYLSIKLELGFRGFETKVSTMIEHSTNLHNGKTLFSSGFPKYFGFIIFLIDSLTKAKGEHTSNSAVYPRLNERGKKICGSAWKDISRLEFLEEGWTLIEKWSNSGSNRSGFNLFEPKSTNRRYVSRLERNVILGHVQLGQLLDSFAKEGYPNGLSLSKDDITSILKKYKNDIRFSNRISEYLKEDSPFSDELLSIVNSYYLENYSLDLYLNKKGYKRNVVAPISLLRCFKKLPGGLSGPFEIKKTTYRGIVTSDFEMDIIDWNGEQIEIHSEREGYTKSMLLDDVSLDLEFIKINGLHNKYAISNNRLWFVKNHNLDEFIQVLKPRNEKSFFLYTKAEDLNVIKQNFASQISIVKVLDNAYVGLKFSNLNNSEFRRLQEVLGIYAPRIEAKISLIQGLAFDRNSKVIRESKAVFEYEGDESDPDLVFVGFETKEELVELKKIEEERFKFGVDSVPVNVKLQIKERVSGFCTNKSFTFVSVESLKAEKLQYPYFKNLDGSLSQEHFERSADDFYDIKREMAFGGDVSEINTWNNLLSKAFKPSVVGDKNPSFDEFEFDSPGELIYSLIQQKKLRANDFVKAIQEFNREIGVPEARRLLENWKHLGYIYYDGDKGYLRPVPASMFHLTTQKGLKVMLTGARDSDFIKRLAQEAKRLHISIKVTNHSRFNRGIFPHRIILRIGKQKFEKFEELADLLGVQYYNNIKGAYNPKKAPYQLACLWFQPSVNQFESLLNKGNDYDPKGFTHEKAVRCEKGLFWNNRNVLDYEEIEVGELIKLEELNYHEQRFIMKTDQSFKLVKDPQYGVFVTLAKRGLHDVLMKTSDPDPNKSISDLYIPLPLKRFPFWIERALLLMNGRVPNFVRIGGKPYFQYRNINDIIIENIEKKLSQQIQTIQIDLVDEEPEK